MTTTTNPSSQQTYERLMDAIHDGGDVDEIALAVAAHETAIRAEAKTSPYQHDAANVRDEI